MPSTYSPNLRIELIASGEQANTWGTTTNTNLGTLIEGAITGYVEVDVTAGDVTLSALNGTVDQSRNMILTAKGTPGVPRTMYCPDDVTKVYVVANYSDDVVTIATVSGTGVVVPVNTAKFVYCDGADVLDAVTSVDAMEIINNLQVDGNALIDNNLNVGGVTTLATSLSGLLKAASGVVSTATSGVDYAPATSGTAILKGNGTGGFSSTTAGVDYSAGTSALATGIVKSTTSTGALSIAAAGVDYQTPITGGATSITTSNLTASRALASDVSGKVAVSATTSTELGYVSGVTSAIQTQIDSKPAKPTGTSAQLLANNGTGGFSNVTVGSGISLAGGTLSATGSGGTVTSVSVVSANGLAGTVATPTTTPAITLSTSISGLLKGNGTAISAASAGTDYVAPAGALGTPASGTLTNCTGLPISTGVSGLGTGVATFLATPSSANLKTAVTDETGSGALVFGTSPSLTTPTATGLIETKTAPTISAGALALNCASGNMFVVSLNANITSLSFSNVPTTGNAYGLILQFVGDGTARTITWGSSVKWPSGTAPIPTATNGKVDTYGLITHDGGITWYGFIAGQNS